MPSIEVRGPQPYTVTIGSGLGRRVSDEVRGRAAIIHQPVMRPAAEELAKVCGPESILIEVPDAEAGKSLDTLGMIWDRLGEAGWTRRDTVVGLGGGAVTDVAGFAAATWMRGICVVQVPTTLLAMVDAAVGGKTGINTALGKNLVGAFHEPTAVLIDLDYLRTLPKEEIVAGSAEIIKTGFIADPVILERYESDPAAALDPEGLLPELIERSVRVKAQVVGEDLKESGLREILNYGHTFGHAVELREDYRWRHGAAVSVGMMFVAHLAHSRGLISASLVRRHRDILQSVGLPTTYEQGHFAALHSAMTKDKKNREGTIRFVVLHGEPGDVTRLEGPSEEELRAAYRALGGDDRFEETTA
ncbi:MULTISPECIES: 3-dehydroquinate synthase [unclassified Corynebacterium]|uniref:3-dehydroquinate synthase n=1 Tax=unclassified Corynebacterium TaxID=2624378 RepID=UPI0029C9B9B3|nr:MULTISPECIES: 3-dehydroquinate synthase [unclassified Corynebacterium]WPF65166.1 3-dehydroquinate synthase [Corynebacterium sp. 22KM0430]WPF67662.1 3-dehydroquinate synthase [Corynebacterium sp. 21KM1197]